MGKSPQHQAAALTMWDKVPDRRTRTQAMRDAFRAKLRKQVLTENEGLTDEAEIENRVDRRLKLHYARMQANSLASRRAAKEAKRQAAADALADAIIEGTPDEAA